MAQYWAKDEKGELYKTENYALAQTTNKVATDNLMPKVYGGLGTSVQVYGFDASIQLSYQLGGQIYDSGYRFMMAGKGDGQTCAIIMETVQGEGGLYPATEEFLKQVRDLCDERDILLILDEIQCGMGRTGYMYAWQRFGVKPDIMTSAKALGCGVPVGAFMMTEKVAQHSLTAGDHGTTYGGNPLACAAVEKVLDLFEEDHIIEHVREVAPYLEQRLNELAEKYDCIQERRGVGLMQGLVFDHPVGDIINRALEKGLILINAGADIIRFVPPLVISRENVDEMIAILDTCIE